MVVVTTGFGQERDEAYSYWRNDGLGQPNLEQPRRTYLVSGQGDGAMIDLFRLRISHYRQDRILSELFDGNPILDDVTAAYATFGKGDSRGVFRKFDAIAKERPEDFQRLQTELKKRLRRDTDVILHLKVGKVAELLDGEDIRISFQNKLLVYMLYRCGAFVPSSAPEKTLTSLHGIPEEQVVRRHGTARDYLLQPLLAPEIWNELSLKRGGARPDPLSQSADQAWPGGYFGFRGTYASVSRRPGPLEEAKSWRREHLPGPTELLASTLCSGVAGYLQTLHDPKRRLRVTLHRTTALGNELLLQQCCNYFGLNITDDFASAARRVFPADNGTIGLAYLSKSVIRSQADVSPEDLDAPMRTLDLNEASSKMSSSVCSLLSIPLLSLREGTEWTAGMLYLDSEEPGFFNDDGMLEILISMLQSFMTGLWETSRSVDRIRNFAPAIVPDTEREVERLGILVDKPEVKVALDILKDHNPAILDREFQLLFQLEFEYSDFIPVGSRTHA